MENLKTHQTKDYAIFKIMYSQVMEENLSKEMAIATQEKPIMVNKDLVVLDGLHRLKSCEKYGLPVYYQIHDMKVVKATRHVDTSQDENKF